MGRRDERVEGKRRRSIHRRRKVRGTPETGWNSMGSDDLKKYVNNNVRTRVRK